MKYQTPSQLSADHRVAIGESLNARLADGLDLHSHLKVAHWNLKGPQFAALHPLFESIAVSLATHNDEIAERAVMLGAQALGSLKHAARSSQLPDYPLEITRDLDHVRLIAERIDVYLAGLRSSRVVCEQAGDVDGVDQLTGIVTEFEKYGWFLRSSLVT
jgi:starvation-inducible DNA-binding protein